MVRLRSNRRDIETLAKELVKETPPASGRDYHFSLDEIGIPESEYTTQWAIIPFSKNRDADFMTECNYDYVKKELDEFDEDVKESHARHWAVGWVDQLFVKMLDAKGDPTLAAYKVADLIAQYENYADLDESCHMEKEYEATKENIAFEMRSAMRDLEELRPLPNKEKLVADVWNWLSKNESYEIEETNGKGAYPSTESVKRALIDLKYAKEME